MHVLERYDDSAQREEALLALPKVAPPSLQEWPAETIELCDAVQRTFALWLAQDLPQSAAAPRAAVCCAPASPHWPVHAQERLLVRDAVPSRQAEFLAGRWCAHRALERVGAAVVVVGRGKLGQPLWPRGITGSISHESQTAVVVAANAPTVAGLGVDLLDTRRHCDMQALAWMVMHDDEMQAVPLAVRTNSHLQKVFCAKEAVVKAISAQVGHYMDWRDITVQLSAGNFEARVRGHAWLVEGRWSQVAHYFVSFAVLHY